MRASIRRRRWDDATARLLSRLSGASCGAQGPPIFLTCTSWRLARDPARLEFPFMDGPHAADDIAVVESFLQALAAQRTEQALALLDDDVVYQNVPLPADRGKAAVTRTLKAFGRFVTGFEVQIRKLAAP